MSYLIRHEAKKIANNLANQPFIDSMVILGSYAEEKMDLYSDIDLYLFGIENLDWYEFTHNPVPLFSSIYRSFAFINWIPAKIQDPPMNERLWIMFLPETFIKVEIHLYDSFSEANEIEGFHQFFLASRPDKLETCVLFDKSKRVSTFLQKWINEKIIFDQKHQLEREIRKFINYYESFFPPFHRGDLYRAHLQVNLCFYKIATIFALHQGVHDHIYCPKMLTNKVLIQTTEQQEFVSILHQTASTMDPLEMQQKIENMFQDVVKIVSENSIPNLHPTDLMNFHNMVHKKYPPFFKFRDFGRISLGEPNLQNKRLYRSSYLSRYPLLNLVRELQKREIKTLIDLRESSEIAEKPYQISRIQKFIPEFRYIHIPITISDNYKKTLKQNNQAYRQIIQIILQKQSPLLVHCVGGTDRTGILFVLLYWLCEVPKAKIVEDYILSVTGKAHFSIEKFMNFLENNDKKMIFNQILNIQNKELKLLKSILTKQE